MRPNAFRCLRNCSKWSGGCFRPWVTSKLPESIFSVGVQVFWITFTRPSISAWMTYAVYIYVCVCRYICICRYTVHIYMDIYKYCVYIYAYHWPMATASGAYLLSTQLLTCQCWSLLQTRPSPSNDLWGLSHPTLRLQMLSCQKKKRKTDCI